MRRYCVNLSDEAAAVWGAYQASHPGLKRDPALDALLLEFAGQKPPEPPEPEYPTDYDVEVSQKGNNVLVRSGIKTLLSTANAASAFKVAVAAVPPGGSMGIGEGTYELEAPYPVALDADGSNIFYCCIQILDKSMHIHGAGVGKTVLKLAPWQRSASRHVAMMLIRSTGPMAVGYSSFSVEGVTFDGNAKYQYASTPHDGEGLILVGSDRKNGVYRDLELKNSFGSGMYLGNNGSGPGTNETVRNVVARNCAAEGIMLDTNKNSRVEDCQAWGCREGLVLNGNDDWQSRGSDNVTATRFKTDSQITCWQVNDFTLSEINMDCTGSPTSRGLVVRDGNGVVKNSILKTDKIKIDARSGPGPTYFSEAARVLVEECTLEGYFGVHAVGQSRVEAKNCQITAPGGCFCTADPVPVSSIIRATGCAWSGKKSDIQEGSSLVEA